MGKVPMRWYLFLEMWIAVVSVFCECLVEGQWMVNGEVSEYNAMINDDAHYVILILPDSKFYTMLLTSDLETRL